jgi:hypothetical protein
MAYTAVVLTEESHKRLLSAVTVPSEWATYAHHMTIELKPIANSMAAELDGQSQTLTVVSLGVSEAAIAVEVACEAPSKNSRKHVTIAVAPGCKPKQSNDIERWDASADVAGMVLEGVVQEVK